MILCSFITPLRLGGQYAGSIRIVCPNWVFLKPGFFFPSAPVPPPFQITDIQLLQISHSCGTLFVKETFASQPICKSAGSLHCTHFAIIPPNFTFNLIPAPPVLLTLGLAARRPPPRYT